MKRNIIIGSSLLFAIGVFVFVAFFYISKNKDTSNNPLSVSTPLTPSTDFNTKPTKLIDLSPYDMEKSKKLWSEASYFLFDGKGWLTQVPLMKKGEDKGVIVVGYGKGATKVLADGYSSISPDGKLAIIVKREAGNGEKPTFKSKYIIKDIETEKTVLETPSFEDVRVTYLDNNSAFHIIVQEQDTLVWYKNNVPIAKIKPPFKPSPLEGAEQVAKDSWIKRNIFQSKAILAMPISNNGAAQIILNGDTMTPQWKYPDDPITGIVILGSTDNNKIFYVCFGKKNLAFFVDEEETIGNQLTDNSLYLYPFFAGDFSARAALSPDGKKFAIVDNSNEPFVRVLGENPKIFRKAYPKGSRILEMSFSPDGKQLYYQVETDFNAAPEKRQTKIVINENEQGPWKWGIQDFSWSKNGEYAFIADDGKGVDIIIKNGIPIRTIPRYTEGAGFELSQLGFSINPVNGKVIYTLEKNTTNYNNTSGEIRSKVVYDEKESREYTGRVYGINWGRNFFSPNGEHLVYIIGNDNNTTDGITLVIDDKEIKVEGTFLGSWGSTDGGFSSDNRWFGIYVMKDNAVWWIPFDLENPK